MGGFVKFDYRRAGFSACSLNLGADNSGKFNACRSNLRRLPNLTQIYGQI